MIDGSAFIRKCFHAVVKSRENSLTPNSKKYIFLKLFRSKIFELIKNYQYGAIIFDVAGKKFRADLLPEYKANRKPVPEKLLEWNPEALYRMDNLGLKILHSPEGYEGDDLIGTIAKKFSNEGFMIDIFSVDKDFLQLVDEKITFYQINEFSKSKIHNYQNFFKLNEGLSPNQIPLYKSLVGDKSDNYSGVLGIGPKNALIILRQFKGEEEFFNFYKKINDLKIRKIISENIEKIRVTLKVARINTELNCSLTLENLLINKNK